MTWTKQRDPLLPTLPTFHDPNRCMTCGHLERDHHPEVGCAVEGGNKYMENGEGGSMRACSCEAFVGCPKEIEEKEQVDAAV